MLPAIVRKFVYPVHEKIMNRKTFSYLKELERMQNLSVGELENIRFKKLKMLLIHSYRNIPFYTDRFNQAGLYPDKIQSIDDIKILPLLSKAEIKNNLNKMKWLECPGGLHRYNTGGSSGEPLIFYFDKRRQAYDKAARMMTHRWWGVDVGEKELYLWGSPVEATKQDKIKSIRDQLTNELLISAFDLSEANVVQIYADIKKFNPKSLFGYPSTISLFAQMAQKQGLDLHNLGISTFFSTAELLYDHQRQSISAAFGGISVADCYGSREGGFVSHQCREGNYHIMDPNYVVEFIKDGSPVSVGEDGEIVLTHLDAWGMPLIRYRTGDVAKPGQNDCTCGCGFTTMAEIRGRTTDFVVTPDGRWQHALSVIYIVRDIVGVDEFKIIQHKLDNVEVLVKILPELYPEKGDSMIVEGIQKRMGVSVDVEVKHVEFIPRDASGKHRYVVSKVSNPIQDD
jgi:phenylacetate-CoA ligase